MRPTESPVSRQIDSLRAEACAAPADLLRESEPEPAVPQPRDATEGLMPDELFVYAQELAEWGARGWSRADDWKQRELTLGSCPTGSIPVGE